MPVNIDVSPEAANRPGFGRFARTGRIIPPDYLDRVGKMPSLTCHASKTKRAADGHAQIDNNGTFGRPRIVTDRAGENAVRDPRYDVSPGRERQPGSDPGAAGLDGSTKGPTRDRLAPAGGKKADSLRSGGARPADPSAGQGDDLDAMEFDLPDGTSGSADLANVLVQRAETRVNLVSAPTKTELRKSRSMKDQICTVLRGLEIRRLQGAAALWAGPANFRLCGFHGPFGFFACAGRSSRMPDPSSTGPWTCYRPALLRLKHQVQHSEPVGHRMLRWTDDTSTSTARNVA